MKDLLLRALPHVVAIAVFAGVASWYFSPCFSGYELRQGDIKNHIGMAKEINDFRAQSGEEALWTNSAFGGMPAYQISMNHGSNWLRGIDKLMRLFLPGPVGILFLSMLGFYILCLCIKVNPWIGIVGALAFGLATINILYLGAGHNSKVHAIAYMAPTLGALLLTMRGKLITGGVLTALFLGLQLTANHLQMTYYLLFLLLFAAAAEGIGMLRKKQHTEFLRAAGVLIVAGILAVLPTFSNLLTTYEYSAYSTRGETELTADAQEIPFNQTEQTGLEKDYILEYSFSKGEILSLLIPDVKGGQSGMIGNDRELLKDVSRQNRQIAAYGLKYWGGQKFTGGAFYFGVIMFFLFVLGMILVKGTLKWGLLILALLSAALSLKDGGGISNFFIESVPLFNKFRDTKMMLVLIQVIFPLMAVLALNELFFNRDVKQKKALLIGTGSMVFLFIIWTASPGAFFDFTNPGDEGHFNSILSGSGITDPAQMALIVEDLIADVESIRMKIFSADATRSLLFVFAIGALVLLVFWQKLNWKAALPLIGILVFWDLIGVDLRYLNKDKAGRGYAHFQDHFEKRYPFEAADADFSIYAQEAGFIDGLEEAVETGRKELQSSIKGKKPKNMESMLNSVNFRELNAESNFRVLFLASQDPESGRLSLVNPTQDARTSYFHKSLGGYHGAKLKRYQELLDFHLMNEMNQIGQALNTQSPAGVFANTGVLNMLNTRYAIIGETNPAIQNPQANGPVWLVEDIVTVSNADEEIAKIGEIDTKKTAVVDERFTVAALSPAAMDSSAYIELESYGPKELIYRSRSTRNELAVFSEIHYPKGWNAYVNGNLHDHIRVNYLLRGLELPAGENEIEFRFEPTSWSTGSTISLLGSILMILLLLGTAFKAFKDYRKQT